MIFYLLIGEKHVLLMFQIGHSLFYKSENQDDYLNISSFSGWLVPLKWCLVLPDLDFDLSLPIWLEQEQSCEYCKVNYKKWTVEKILQEILILQFT